MATATTTQVALLDRILAGLQWQMDRNIERDEDLDLLYLCAIAREHPLYLGEAGVGKTYFIEQFTEKVMTDARLYTHLLAKDQSADELLGPRDIMGYKAGKVRRLTDGYSPDSNVSYWDEVFKASPPMLNPALDLLANRRVKMGGEVLDCPQLMLIVMSSNELPDREDLMAFRDRIALTKLVLPIRTNEGRRELIDLHLEGSKHDDVPDPLSASDWDEANALAMEVDFPHNVRERLTEAWRMWAEAKHAPSARRVTQMIHVMKASAWKAGRDTVNADDLLVCQHCAWNKPDDAKSALEVVIALAEQYTREAEEIRQAQEPISREVSEIKLAIRNATTDDDRDELQEKGFKLLRQTKTLIRKAEGVVEQGEGEGEDTTRVKGVIEQLEKWHDQSEKEISATDV